MNIEIVVANKKHAACGEYVGRPSPLGNPYSHLPLTLAKYRVATRDEAIKAYRGWLEERIGAKDPRVCGELQRLAALARERGTLMLVCWCSPLRCHAEVVRDILLPMVASPTR